MSEADCSFVLNDIVPFARQCDFYFDFNNWAYWARDIGFELPVSASSCFIFIWWLNVEAIALPTQRREEFYARRPSLPLYRCYRLLSRQKHLIYLWIICVSLSIMRLTCLSFGNFLKRRIVFWLSSGFLLSSKWALLDISMLIPVFNSCQMMYFFLFRQLCDLKFMVTILVIFIDGSGLDYVASSLALQRYAEVYRMHVAVKSVGPTSLIWVSSTMFLPVCLICKSETQGEMHFSGVLYWRVPFYGLHSLSFVLISLKQGCWCEWKARSQTMRSLPR